MLVAVIGDPHGTKYWSTHIDFKKYKHIVILGDWFDDWNNDWENHDQIENLKQALSIKISYPENFHLCIGNHDLAYLIPELVSGHQHNKAVDIKEFLEANLHYFDVVVKISNYYFSHAGVSKWWMRNNSIAFAKTINSLLQNRMYNAFRIYSGSITGDSELNGPTWIRPDSLVHCMYYKHQVVGHTAVKGLYKKVSKFGNTLYIVDNREHSAFLELKL